MIQISSKKSFKLKIFLLLITACLCVVCTIIPQNQKVLLLSLKKTLQQDLLFHFNPYVKLCMSNMSSVSS